MKPIQIRRLHFPRIQSFDEGIHDPGNRRDVHHGVLDHLLHGEASFSVSWDSPRKALEINTSEDKKINDLSFPLAPGKAILSDFVRLI